MPSMWNPHFIHSLRALTREIVEWRKHRNRRNNAKKQFTIVEQDKAEIAIQNAKEVKDALEELEKQGEQVDIPSLSKV
jgi:hypothetical protein